MVEPLPHRSNGKAWWLIGVWLIGLILLFKPWVHGVDPVGYYSWLRTAVIDGNLDTTNEYYYYGEEQYHIIFPGPSGYNKDPYAIGSALLWSPFFITAHIISIIFHQPTDGYAPLYVIGTSLGTAAYALAGLWLAYRLTRELFDRRAAKWAVVGIWWSTPLLFYMYSDPTMSHANDAFVTALFVYVWYRTRSGTYRSWLGRGFALGLAALVRTQNVLLVLLPISEAITLIVKRRQLNIWFWLTRAALFGAAAIIAFLPQAIVWQQTYGSFFPGNPYSVYGDTFDFTSPHFFDVLFSTVHGLFVWSPLVFLGIIGLVIYTWRVDFTLALGLTLTWIAQVYLVGSWSQWSGASAFGQRFMVNGTIFYIIGLAALINRLKDKIKWRYIIGAVLFFMAWNGLLIAQFIVELIPRGGPVDLGVMIAGQFRVIGIVIERLGDLIAARFQRVR